MKSPNVFNYWVEKGTKMISPDSFESIKDRANKSGTMFGVPFVIYEGEMYFIEYGPKSPDSKAHVESPEP